MSTDKVTDVTSTGRAFGKVSMGWPFAVRALKDACNPTHAQVDVWGHNDDTTSLCSSSLSFLAALELEPSATDKLDKCPTLDVNPQP